MTERICKNCKARKPIYKRTKGGQVKKDTSWICQCDKWNYSKNTVCFTCNKAKVTVWSFKDGFNKYSEDMT